MSFILSVCERHQQLSALLKNEAWESFKESQRVPITGSASLRLRVGQKQNSGYVDELHRASTVWWWVTGRVVMMQQQQQQQRWTSVQGGIRYRSSNSAKHKRINNNQGENKDCLTERREFYKSHKHHEETTHCQHKNTKKTSNNLSRIK